MHPYKQLGPSAFWSTGVAQKGLDAVAELWDAEFPIARADDVVTFGSCFAQHFGRALRQRGFSWLITEKTPVALTGASRRKFSYDLFSARTGNIYTTSLLEQWVSWALGEARASDEIWAAGGRCFDPFRPVVEPDGFADEAELRVSRQHTLASFKRAISRARVMVFTLGLTESWRNSRHGWEYPMCPGTSAGAFDAAQHSFVNQDYDAVRRSLVRSIALIRAVNPEIRMLLTVSPVPLTATMSGEHVLMATMESKSILRAVAGSVAREVDGVDYFPAYEIIASPAFRGMFFEANQRTVSDAGVDTVMACFFGALERKFGSEPVEQITAVAETKPPDWLAANFDYKEDDAVCEELLLEAFAPKV